MTVDRAAWGIAKGHSVIPKSKTPARIRANAEGDFRLAPEDVARIDGLDKKTRFNVPAWAGSVFKGTEGVETKEQA